jgi:peptide/nickel transport system ATP-binding protein
MPIVEIENLKMHYETIRGFVRAVENVSLKLEKGKTLGLAGESGCGKTSIALSILRLLPSNGRILDGKVVLDGQNLLELGDKEFDREVRWKKLSVIFQGAMNALHPIFTVGDQIAEAITLHENVESEEALDRAGRLLDLVGVKAERIDRYPHELSGGMKQRVMIAMALACNPLLVIADEPTTALDVLVQAQVIKVLNGLQEKMNLSIIEISHDLSLIARTCNDVAIMYAGRIVEYGQVIFIYKDPLHPYTQRLISAFPSVVGPRKELATIPGFPPNLLTPPRGCKFHARCPFAKQICVKKEPELTQVEKGHHVACHLVEV